ncbi:MAG TPA: sialidase family protein [Chitinophagaceae bacterium]|nr:sialidase family protein [Chitinophagaceae bacterium]
MKASNLFFLFFLFVFSSYSQTQESNNIIAKGHMPNIARDKSNTIHIVYGSGDSILYILSRNGKHFSSPSLVAVLPKLVASAMRGPQIASVGKGLTITACTKDGNIFSYNKNVTGKWSKPTRVNDENESAKEGLMSLSGDGLTVFAVWLGVRNPKGQNVIGARSLDGGKTWSKNMVVYASPDNSVCECCKPSVVMKANNVYVMFRNWLNGNRDLYLIRSVDGGRSFGNVQKLGNGSWKLSGCPMDGGGLVINKNGIPETVWRREGKIYASIPGMPEKEVGDGKNCTIEIVNGKNVYAWVENGAVVVIKPRGQKKVLGKGSLPVLKSLNNEHVICIWENEKQIHASVIEL